MNNQLTTMLNISLSLIQAPMAGGITSPELVAAVSNAGGLGSLGAGMMSPEAMREAIREIKQLTDKPFAVNLFTREIVDDATIMQQEAMCKILNQVCQELDVTVEPVEAPFRPAFSDQAQVIIDEQVPIFSFTFGLPEQHWIAKFKEANITVIGTATAIAEVEALADAEVDAIVLQGIEAGGHRGTFIGPAHETSVTLAELVEQAVANEKITLPLIAAGGITTAEQVSSLLSQGIDGVQVGTLFVASKESGAAAIYKQKLIEAHADTTTLTPVFSGRTARVMKNNMVDKLAPHITEVPAYPVQNKLTTPIRKAAAKQNNPEFMSLYAGQALAACHDVAAAELVEQLMGRG